MSLKDLPRQKAGFGATLIALLVLAGALAIIAVAVWLLQAPQGAKPVPAQPNQAAKPTSRMRVPSIRDLPAAGLPSPV